MALSFMTTKVCSFTAKNRGVSIFRSKGIYLATNITIGSPDDKLSKFLQSYRNHEFVLYRKEMVKKTGLQS